MDDHIEVCHWYTTMRQLDGVTGKETDVKACAITWMPVLASEQSSAGRMVAESIQSLRNETVKRQDEAIKSIARESNVKAINNN